MHYFDLLTDGSLPTQADVELQLRARLKVAEKDIQTTADESARAQVVRSYGASGNERRWEVGSASVSASSGNVVAPRLRRGMLRRGVRRMLRTIDLELLVLTTDGGEQN